ncbi:Squalene epoxidase [Dissophora globulifera]|nr:Squalene epoxidase [Dissophora globulifera]
MTEEAQQKIRSLVEMAMSYVVEPQPLSVPPVPETLNALVERLANNLSLSETVATPHSQVQEEEEAWDGEAFGVRLAGLGKLLANDVTKTTLACKPPAEAKMVIGMVDALAETCFRLAGFVESIPVKIAGQTYKREIQTLANNIFLATAGLMNEFLEVKNEKVVQVQQQKLTITGDVQGLGKAAADRSSSTTESDAAKGDDVYLMKTGIVWEACQIFEQASRSNRQAVARKWGDMTSTLEDAIAEVQEMIDSNDSKKDGENDRDDSDDSDDDSGSESDDSWNDDEKMTEEEKQLSIRSNAILKLTKMLLKKLQQRCLDTQPSLALAVASTAAADASSPLSAVAVRPSDLNRMWDQLYDSAGGIVALADEIATSLYSPQDQTAVVALLQDLNQKNHDCIQVGRLFVRGQAEHEKWLDMCEAQAKKIIDTVALTPSLATVPVPDNGSTFDIIVVGAGVLGSAFASTFAKQGKRILLLERDLSEPDRIVGELLQPGGYKALKELGLSDCLEGIDAIPTYGYGVIRGSEHVHIPYLVDPETGKQDQGRSFHHGRFIQKLRTAASQTPNVTIVEATVNEVVHDEDNGVRVAGITCTHKKDSSAEATESGATSVTAQYFAPLTVIADGCFSKFRKQFIQKPVATVSHFVGFVMKDVQLPFPNHGHVILASPSPILMYQISTRDTRILVDVPGKLPSASSGALRSYLENIIYPQLPATIQKQFLVALETERLRSMPNSFLPPSTSSELGVILLGDAMNMRHPLTGGGMTVALNDVVYLRDMLAGDVTKDQEETMVQMEIFFWKRKELSGVINVLAQALYALFSGGDENLIVLRDGCFSYFKMGGECITGPVGLLSGMTRRRMVLVYHFYAVALHSIWLMFHKATWAELPVTLFKAFSVLWTASVALLPVMWSECKA